MDLLPVSEIEWILFSDYLKISKEETQLNILHQFGLFDNWNQKWYTEETFLRRVNED